MQLLARARWLLARRPWVYWCAVGLCAAGVWAGVSGDAAALRAARASWGRTRRVWVSPRAVEAGQPLTGEPRDWPEAMVPVGALARPPTGLAAQHVAAGEVLVGADEADGRLPAGWVVFAVAPRGSPTLLPGARVAVFVAATRTCDGLVAGPTAGADQVEIAVPPACAAAVAGGVRENSVVLARAP